MRLPPEVALFGFTNQTDTFLLRRKISLVFKVFPGACIVSAASAINFCTGIVLIIGSVKTVCVLIAEIGAGYNVLTFGLCNLFVGFSVLFIGYYQRVYSVSIIVSVVNNSCILLHCLCSQHSEQSCMYRLYQHRLHLYLYIQDFHRFSIYLLQSFPLLTPLRKRSSTRLKWRHFSAPRLLLPPV